jgi:hypothetical protein
MIERSRTGTAPAGGDVGGVSRPETTRIGGATLQIVRDSVLKYTAIERGPIPAAHGEVRWRIIDLAQWHWDAFSASILKPDLSRELLALSCRKLSARLRHRAKEPSGCGRFLVQAEPCTERAPLIIPGFVGAYAQRIATVPRP